MAMFNRIDGMYWFGDGLQLLADRTGLAFDPLAKEIGALDHPHQVAAKIRQLVDGLPLPATFPPVEIGGFRRLDAVAEIRDLAKTWQNCLADYACSMLMTAHSLSVGFLARHGRACSWREISSDDSTRSSRKKNIGWLKSRLAICMLRLQIADGTARRSAS